MRHAHGAGVAAPYRQRVASGGLAPDQEGFQFLQKISGAGWGFGVAGREVESQCGQRVQHAVFAHALAVNRFYPQDADHHRGGNAGFALGALQGLGIAQPKLHSRLDPHRVHHAVAVHLPITHARALRRGDGTHHLGQHARLCQRVAHPTAA